MADLGVNLVWHREPALICESFVEVMVAMKNETIAALFPDFLTPARDVKSWIVVRQIPKLESQLLHFHLAWNPRLLRLNPHAASRRDWLLLALTGMASERGD